MSFMTLLMSQEFIFCQHSLVARYNGVQHVSAHQLVPKISMSKVSTSEYYNAYDEMC